MVILDTLEYGHKQAIPSTARFIKGNVGDKDVVSGIFAKNSIDGVLHFAGYIGRRICVKNPIRYMQK